jgi:c-di-GMP-binding flagellar brake protein YcgR
MRAHVICIADSQTMRGVSWNLSHGGILAEVSSLNPKDAVQLSFRLPVSSVAIDAVGTVVWGDERRKGIQFTNVGPQSQQSIRQFITERTEH